jgi:hypothetical protein
LKNSSTLETLYLKHCRISKDNLKTIVAGLEHNTDGSEIFESCRYYSRS